MCIAEQILWKTFSVFQMTVLGWKHLVELESSVVRFLTNVDLIQLGSLVELGSIRIHGRRQPTNLDGVRSTSQATKPSFQTFILRIIGYLSARHSEQLET